MSITDTAQADRITIATSELLENGVKYACGEEPSIHVRITADGSGTSTIMVENQATPEATERFTHFFESIMQGDPLEMYVEKMREAAHRPEGTSQLGLARIRFETGAHMQLHVSEDNRIRVTLVI